MIRFVLFLAIASFSSCFLFRDYSERTISYTADGDPKSMTVIVPRKYDRSEKKVDSAGNEVQYFYYGNGAVLYFARLQDTSATFQYIDYYMNIPQHLYHTLYYKGVYPDGRYWRETRFGNYKAGYYKVDENSDGTFDSSLNYFSLRSVTR